MYNFNCVFVGTSCAKSNDNNCKNYKNPIYNLG